jgi:voltage-gated potassium channel
VVRYTIAYVRSVFEALAHPRVRPYLTAVTGLILLGTLVYSWVERWHPLDAAYFCVITLATVGYGDFAPVTRLGKLFTMVYIIAGLGLLGGFIATITSVSMEKTQGHAPADGVLVRGTWFRARVGRSPDAPSETEREDAETGDQPPVESPR